MKQIYGLALAIFALATPTQAEQLTGKEVQAVFSAGAMGLVAGSVGKFESDGSYRFNHGSKTQRGSYSVAANGVVTFVDGATSHGFILDKNAKGKIDLIYVAGPQKGDKYRLR